MLLADATSAEQVARALREGDDELALDIEEQLDAVKSDFRAGVYNWNYIEPGEIDVEDVMTSDEFIAEVKSTPVDSGQATGFDLADVPDEYLIDHLRYEAGRFGQRNAAFQDSESLRGYGHFSFEVKVSDDVYFPDQLFGDVVGAEHIPTDIVRDFWRDLADEFDIEWYETTDEVGTNYGWREGEPRYFVSDAYDWEEFARDVAGSYISGLIDTDPEKAAKVFEQAVTAQGYGRTFQQIKPFFSTEDLNDFAHRYFMTNDAEDVLEEMGEMAAMVRDPGTSPEVIMTITRDDLVALGIKQGALYENAPWYLVKLRPFELPIEGTRMRHCVGDKGMGYITELNEGNIEIWSLRSGSPLGKPRFTVEVGWLWEKLPGRIVFDNQRVFKQIKGKANRTPGYTHANTPPEEIRWPEEIVLWMKILSDLGTDPWAVDDMEDAVAHLYDAFGVLREPYRHFRLVQEWPRARGTKSGEVRHEWFARNPSRSRVRRSFNRAFVASDDASSALESSGPPS